jgi:hypothetical protein
MRNEIDQIVSYTFDFYITIHFGKKAFSFICGVKNWNVLGIENVWVVKSKERSVDKKIQNMR